VQVIGILLRPDATGPEPRLPLFGVDPLDAPNDPLALGDRILDRTGFHIDQIQMVPAASLAHPDQFVVAEPETEEFIRIVHKGLRRLVGNRPCCAAGRIHGNQPHNLMAPLVIDERKSRAVGRPPQVLDAPRRCEDPVGDIDGLLALDVEQVGPRLVDPVARLGVVDRVQLRLELVLRRRLHERDLAILTLADPHRHQLLGIRRPQQLSREPVLGRTVGRQSRLFFTLNIAEPNIVVFEERRPLSIRRFTPLAPGPRARVTRPLVLCLLGNDCIPCLRRRDKDRQPPVLLIGCEPYMPGEGVLAVLPTRGNGCVMFPLAAFVIPIYLDLEVAPVDKSNPGLRARLARGPQSPLHRQRLSRDILARHFLHCIGSQIAAVSLALDVEAEFRCRIIETQPIDPQPIGLDLLAGRLRQRLGQPRRVERRLASARLGIYEDVLAGPVGQVVAVPEPVVALQPVGPYPVTEDLVGQRLRQCRGPIVIALGPLCESACAQPQQDQNNHISPMEIQVFVH
jgi:hypothetical protein